jgi:hypothetical protein
MEAGKPRVILTAELSAVRRGMVRSKPERTLRDLPIAPFFFRFPSRCEKISFAYEQAPTVSH